MTPASRVRPPSPRNGAGTAALVLGVSAMVALFIPIVGEFVTGPAAIAAVGAAFIGFDRADKGHATNRTEAIIGGGFGLLALLFLLLVFAATHSHP